MSEQPAHAEGAPDPRGRDAADVDLTSASVEELQERAAARGVEGRVGMGKDELLDALGLRRDGADGPERR